jgi:2OG-Fe(II) oxygenase superfamily
MIRNAGNSIAIAPLLVALFTIFSHDANYKNDNGHWIFVEGRVFPSATALTLFAHNGFDATTSRRYNPKRKSNNNKKNDNKNKQQLNQPPKIAIDLSTPQSRMDHIAKCIERADVSPMMDNRRRQRFLPTQEQPNQQQQQQPTCDDLNEGATSIFYDNSICYVDNFLGPQLILAMRAEAESLLAAQPHAVGTSMVPSQSTRWDEETQSVIAYEKVGVLSTQIEGGPEGYAATPRLVEYVVTLTKHLSEKINAIVPDDYKLSCTQQTNKLAVCLGGGSKYDKHIDNLGDGQGDRRKMTALLYLQPPGSHDDTADEGENDVRGGYFRAYDVPEEGQVKVLAPRGDRLLLFWSDSLVHDVSPSFVQDEANDRRWALTVWFVADEGGKIRGTDAKIEQRHFGHG